jgi:hypothetical protein
MRFPARVTSYCPFCGIQICCGAHPASYTMGDRDKTAGREADLSPPSNLEVNNGGSISYPIHLHSMALNYLSTGIILHFLPLSFFYIRTKPLLRCCADKHKLQKVLVNRQWQVGNTDTLPLTNQSCSRSSVLFWLGNSKEKCPKLRYVKEIILRNVVLFL